MIVFVNQRSKKTRRQKKQQAESWQAYLKKSGVERKTNTFKPLSVPVPVGMRTGANDFKAVSSLHTNESYTSKKLTLQYTGDAMLGVATMHKSNSVPVFTEQQAEDLAKMRRG